MKFFLHRRYGVAVAMLSCSTLARAAADIDFAAEIQPVIEAACLRCHNADAAEGGLRLDSRDAALRGGDNGPAIVAGDPLRSPLYTLTVLPEDDESLMPPDETPLDVSQTSRIRQWIEQGAPWPTKAKLEVRPRIDFVEHIQPLLEQHCVACHNPETVEGGYDLSTRQMAFTTGDAGPALFAFQPTKSRLYTLAALPAESDEIMPPDGPLDRALVEQLRLWIAQGAIWPANLRLTPQERTDSGSTTPDNRQLIERIYAEMLAKSKQQPDDSFADYSNRAPLSGADYHMVAISGGEFLMGSPADESQRQPIEGPQVEVRVEPFWMGKFEVTWDEYEPYMITNVDRAKHGGRVDYDESKHGMVDAVSQPTAPYIEMSFGMGQKGFPAISMTQHAANKYCQWLSAQTGHFYRLPTEAEWEYACRAGTATAYSFGDDLAKLPEYGWFYDNSDEKYQKVGLKKANPWGLHDMHGNVMEWTADQFAPDYFTRIAGSAENPWVKPDQLYPRAVRGGGWDDDPEQLRSAARRGSDPGWKIQDPQLPKSIWYHTNARWLGFRIVRPKKLPSLDEVDFYWNSAAGKR